jgi:uncharacterized ParB-like nuclease family protein
MWALLNPGLDLNGSSCRELSVGDAAVQSAGSIEILSLRTRLAFLGCRRLDAPFRHAQETIHLPNQQCPGSPKLPQDLGYDHGIDSYKCLMYDC